MRDIARNVRIVVKRNGVVVASRKKVKVAPGEMETIRLDGALLRDADGQTLSIALEAQ